jgi:hypothetical protein
VLSHPHLLDAILLVAGTVAVHSIGSLAIRWLRARSKVWSGHHFGFAQNTLVITTIVLALLLIHWIEVSLWARYYFLKKCFADLPTSVYFSLTAYTTLGGNVMLGEEWRLLGGVEALTGMLMIGWSTAIMIGYIMSNYSRQIDQWCHRPDGGSEYP